MTDPEEARELLLEARDLLAEDEPAAREDARDRRVDGGALLRVVLLEGAEGDAGRHPGRPGGHPRSLTAPSSPVP